MISAAITAVIDWFLSWFVPFQGWYLSSFNSFAWIAANVLVIYISVALLVFVMVYSAIFDPKATTGGLLIFRFMVSLVGVVGLVFISIFLNPTDGRAWHAYPGDVYWWRPMLRMVAYAYVSYSTTKLISYLIKRKWFPHKLKKIAPEELVLTRDETK